MGRFLWAGVLLAVILIIYALVDLIRTPPRNIQGLPKWAWIVIVIAVPAVGAILWIAYGRYGYRNASKSSAPDDDPSFLQKIDDELRRIADDLKNNNRPDKDDEDEKDK